MFHGHLEKNGFCLGRMFDKRWSGPVCGVLLSSGSSLIFCLAVHHLLREACCRLQLELWFCLFLLSVPPVSALLCRGSVVWCADIQESRVFLVGWLFYRYMYPSVSCSFLCPVVPVSIDLMQYGPFRFLLDNVCMVCLMPPSSFSLPRRHLGFLLDSTEQVTGCSLCCRSRSVVSVHRHLCLVYMSGLAPAIFYLFSVCSLSSHFSVPFLLPVCGFLEQFLEFYFDLSVIFFSIFPCIAFLVVSLDISYLPLCLLTLFSSWCNCLISSTLDSGIIFASIVKHNLENSRGQEGLRYLDLFLSASFFLPSWCSAFLPREVPVTIS